MKLIKPTIRIYIKYVDSIIIFNSDYIGKQQMFIN